LQIETRHFGPLDYEDTELLTFPRGLPGFPDARRFILIPESDPPDLFYWLQSVDDGRLAFVLMDVYRVLPDYNPLVDGEQLEDLGELDEASLHVYNITVIPDDIKKMRVNLKAPVIIHEKTRLGKQVMVNNDDYEVRYMIMEAMSG